MTVSSSDADTDATASEALSLSDRMFDDRGVLESRHVVLALMKSDEIEIAVDWLRSSTDAARIRIEDHGVYYRIDGDEGFSFDLDSIAELIGKPYNVYDFLVNVATTIGRAYVSGNTFTITTDLIGWEREVPR